MSTLEYGHTGVKPARGLGSQFTGFRKKTAWVGQDDNRISPLVMATSPLVREARFALRSKDKHSTQIQKR
jgi:hypothetical protein